MRSIRYRADRLGKQILQGPLGQTVGQPDLAVDQDILHSVFVYDSSHKLSSSLSLVFPICQKSYRDGEKVSFQFFKQPVRPRAY